VTSEAAPDAYAGAVAAWVAGRPIAAAVIDQRLAALRRGPLAARLPHPDSAEGRNLRRWVAQLVTVEAVVRHEAARRGITATPEDGRPQPVTLGQALRTGGMTAAVLAADPLARALRRRVLPAAGVPEADLEAYYARNRDRHAGPYPEERTRIAATLTLAVRDRAFAQWLDERCAALVRSAPGYEHPADPTHPDATHHH
jgi:[acyl-carrier-protein] S-malonyltransferase